MSENALSRPPCPLCGGRTRVNGRGETRQTGGGGLSKLRLRCTVCGHSSTVYDSAAPCDGHAAERGRVDDIALEYLSCPAAEVARRHGCDPKTVRAMFGTWLRSMEARRRPDHPRVAGVARAALCSAPRLALFDAERLELHDLAEVGGEPPWISGPPPSLVLVTPDADALGFARRCWPRSVVAVDPLGLMAATAPAAEAAARAVRRDLGPDAAAALDGGLAAFLRDATPRSDEDEAALGAWARHPALAGLLRAKDALWAALGHRDAEAGLAALADWADGDGAARAWWRARAMLEAWREPLLAGWAETSMPSWAAALDMSGLVDGPLAGIGVRRFDAVRAFLLHACPEAADGVVPMRDLAAAMARVADAQHR